MLQASINDKRDRYRHHLIDAILDFNFVYVSKPKPILANPDKASAIGGVTVGNRVIVSKKIAANSPSKGVYLVAAFPSLSYM